MNLSQLLHRFHSHPDMRCRKCRRSALWSVRQKYAPIIERLGRDGYHGTCAEFADALHTDPAYICSRCGAPKWRHDA